MLPKPAALAGYVQSMKVGGRFLAVRCIEKRPSPVVSRLFLQVVGLHQPIICGVGSLSLGIGPYAVE